jgi:hypothetical protein
LSYRLDIDSLAQDQIRGLPPDVLLPLAEAMVMLGLTPWNGDPINDRNPDGNVRILPFGPGGMITYLILEGELRVDVLEVLWVG